VVLGSARLEGGQEGGGTKTHVGAVRFALEAAKAEFESRHVFFQKEDAETYIGKILARVAASTVSAAGGGSA
jgi:hypothetical protein